MNERTTGMNPLFICVNRKGLEDFLPHRGSALRKIDGIFYDPAAKARITGLKAVNADDQDLEGHFPGSPTYPGYAQDEFICLAAAALISIGDYGLKTNPHVVQKMVRYKKNASPGDTLIADIKLDEKKSRFFLFSGQIINQNQELVAEYERIVGAV